MMKNIHQRDKLKLIEDIFKNCHKAILIDQKQDYVYTKLMIWYTDSKVPEEKQAKLEQIIKEFLSEEKGKQIMRTIAQKYIEEGEARGEARGVEKIACRMLKENTEVKFIASVTGLSTDEILKLKNTL